MKKILLLASHFTPDRSAGSFRMSALVYELAKYPDLLECHVFSMYPNRYQENDFNILNKEIYGNVKITRIPLLFSNSTGLRLIINYFYYFLRVILQTKFRRYDIVFATSSKFFTSFLGLMIVGKKSKLIIDYRDLFWDNIKDLYSIKLLNKIGRAIEKNVLLRADKISIVSKGFTDYVAESSGDIKKISYFPNGIDSLFITESDIDELFENKFRSSEKIEVLYAGNVGVGQGLEKIIPVFAKKFEANCSITIIGNGSKKDALQLCLDRNDNKNVTLLPSMPRENILQSYQRADILLLTLNDIRAFEKVLPSKIFEYAATGLPILAGVCGHARDFFKSEIEGVFVFSISDLDEMEKQFELLLSKRRRYCRDSFIEKYRREKIIYDLAEFILSES